VDPARILVMDCLTTRELAFQCLNDWRLPLTPDQVEILIELAECQTTSRL
jgi:hypothetical protein